jgi:hypothetical protein
VIIVESKRRYPWDSAWRTEAMKKLALTILSTAALALSPWRVAHAQGSLAPFQIILEKTDKGVDLQCAKGCAWKTATYACSTPSRSNEPVVVLNGIPVESDNLAGCRFEINERSVGPAPRSRSLHLNIF